MTTRQEKVVLPIAKRIAGRYDASVIDGEIYYFLPRRGHRHGRSSVDDLVVHIDPETTIHDRKEIYDLLLHCLPKREFANPRFIGFSNGDLDLATCTLLSMAPRRIIPSRIPWAWQPDCLSQATERYLDSMANGKPEIRALIEEMLGATLYRGNIGRIFLLVGRAPVRGGSAGNGKSTLLEIASLLVGRENVCQISLPNIGKQFLMRGLAGKLLYAPDDAANSKVPPETQEVLKKVATQQVIEADVKHQRDTITFRPYATPVIAANSVPRGLASDDGLRRRLAPIVLTAKFKQGGANPAVTLDNDNDMSVLASYAVEGLKRLLDSGLTACAAADEILLGTSLLDSTVRQWVDDQSVSETDLIDKTVADSYSAFAAWASMAGYRPQARRGFQDELLDVFPTLEVTKRRLNGSTPKNRWTPRK